MPLSIPRRPAPRRPNSPSVLAWSAWWRVLVVIPAVLVLWLTVAWAQLEAAPWWFRPPSRWMT
ncbi:MAG: hypothetical protein H7224_05985 [Polaromonas sp.]|nr:hypothetical protein [Polaromonas sp.]